MNYRRLASWLLPLLGFGASLAAASSWQRGISGNTLVVDLVVASLVPFLLTAATEHLCRGSLAIPIGVNLVSLLVVLLAVVLRSPLGFAQLRRGFTDGIAHLLSATLPLANTAWILVVPVTLCWLGATFASNLLVRSSASSAALVVWFAEFTLAYAATSGAPGNEVLDAVGLILLAGSFVLVRRWLVVRDSMLDASGDDRPFSVARPLVIGVLTLVVVAVIADVALPRVPGLNGQPVALSRQPPVTNLQTVTPIATTIDLRSGADGPTSAPLFQVTTDAALPDYVTIATVNRYDGNSWTFASTFLPTGGRVPSVPESLPSRGVLVTEHYAIDSAFPPPWLPFMAQPVATVGVSTDVDESSGTIVTGQTLGAGSRFTVSSVATPVTLLQLPSTALVGASPTSFDDAIPNGIADDVRTIVAAFENALDIPSAASEPVAFLQGVDRYLLSNDKQLAVGTSSAGTEGGTSFADVTNAVLVTKIATPEQFATFFALIARAVGVPARVATGFRLRNLSVASLAPGTYTVRRSQAWTWVELSIVGSGWVVADPTPITTAAAQTPEFSATSTSSTTTTLVAPTAVANTLPGGQHAVAPPVRTAQRSGASSTLWIAIGSLLAALFIAAAAAPGIRRKRRQRRRQSGAPGDRVVGAWHELLDGLQEAEVDETEVSTASELVALIRDRFGDAAAGSVQVVGASANRAIFSSRSPISDEDASRAWAAEQAALRHVRDELPWRERLASRLRVAPRRPGSSDLVGTQERASGTSSAGR